MADKKEMKFSIVLAAIDKASQVISTISSKAIKNLDKVQKKTETLARQSFSFARQAASIGLVTGGLLASTVAPAAELQTRLANVGTLVDTNVESLGQMQDEILAIATNVPAKIDDIAASLYDVRSAGIGAGDAMKVVEASSKLSVAGLSTATEATDILTSAYNAFKSEGLEVSQINDILFKTVKAGKTTISALAQSFGATAPIVQSAGVKLMDFQAATAALTTVGTPASQAQTQLRAAVVALLKPTADMQKLFKVLGVKDGPELIKKSGGLGQTFKNLKNAAAATSVNLNKAWSSTEAMAAATSVAGETNKAYLETLDNMANGANAVDEAFEKQSQTFNSQKQIFMNNIQSMAISVGSVLLPALVDLMKHLKPIIESIRTWVTENPRMTKAIVGATAAISVITLGLSGLGFIFGGVMQAIAVGAKLFKAVTFVIRAVALATRLMNLTLLANPFVLVAAAAIAAGILIYKYWDNIKAFFMGLWDWIKSNWDIVLASFLPFIGIPILIIRNWGKISDFFKNLWDGIVQKAGALYTGLKKIFQKVRNLLPFSPAKEGPFTDIHRVKIVETIAAAQKPDSLVRKMKLISASAMVAVAPLGGTSSPTPFASPFNQGGTGSSGITINYQPNIIVHGAGSPESVKLNILSALREHSGELVRIIEEAQGRRQRRSFS